MVKYDKQLLAQEAIKGLLYEVSLSPKPGLVDRYNTGSHDDMNFYQFIDSSFSLLPFFEQYLDAGYNHHGPLPQLFHKIRQIGISAECKMFQATGGINTHKGANFSFALILAATGYYLQTERPLANFTEKDSRAILATIPQICREAISKDLEQAKTKTKPSYGEQLYLEFGLKGIRGEALTGYPSLEKLLLPELRQLLTIYPVEEAFLQALLRLMIQVEDSNLIHRGGLEAWQTIQIESQEALKKNLQGAPFYQWLAQYDQTLIQRHLSPGGSADLLALGYFFMRLEDRL